MKQFTVTETGLNLFVHKHLIPLLLNKGMVTLKKKLICLDFGCGRGELCRLLAYERERMVIGIDLSLTNIKSAKAYANDFNTHWILCDGQHLPFRRNIFDFIFTIGVLHHIPNLRQAFAEISRVCRNNGYIIGTEPNLFHPHVTSLISSPRILQLFSFIEKGEKPIDPRNLVRLLEAKGFHFFYKDFRLGLKFLATPFELILKPAHALKIYELLVLFDCAIPPILRNSFCFCARKLNFD